MVEQHAPRQQRDLSDFTFRTLLSAELAPSDVDMAMALFESNYREANRAYLERSFGKLLHTTFAMHGDTPAGPSHRNSVTSCTARTAVSTSTPSPRISYRQLTHRLSDGVSPGAILSAWEHSSPRLPQLPRLARHSGCSRVHSSPRDTRTQTGGPQSPSREALPPRVSSRSSDPRP